MSVRVPSPTADQPAPGRLIVAERTTRWVRRTVEELGGWVVVVLVLVAALSLVRALGPLTYPGDIWRESDTATIARNFARDGMQLFWPQIDWRGAGPGYVESELPLMPWLAAALYLVFGEHPSLGRLVSLAFTVLAAAAFWGLARRLLPLPAARWAMAAFALSPVVMRWGTAFMPDATALAFTVVALLFFCRWLAEDRGVLLAAAAAATSMAALVKPTALNVGLIMALWLLSTHRDRFRRPSIYVAGVAALVLPALWLRHAARLHAVYGNTFGVLSGGDSKWGSIALWLGPDFYLGNIKAESLFVYGLVGVPFALVGAVWLARRRRTGSTTAAFLVAGAVGLAIYYAAVGRYSSSDLGLQYHVYSLPYAAVAVGAGVAAVLRWCAARTRRPAGARPTVTVLAVVFVLALGAESAYVLGRSFTDDSGSLGVCATVLDRVSSPTDLVVVGTTSTSVMDGVTNNFEEPIVFFRADRKGWSLPADQYEPNLVAAYRSQGARYFVNPEPDLLPPDSPLTRWLDDHTTVLDTSSRNGCGVWALSTR